MSAASSYCSRSTGSLIRSCADSRSRSARVSISLPRVAPEAVAQVRAGILEFSRHRRNLSLQLQT